MNMPRRLTLPNSVRLSDMLSPDQNSFGVIRLAMALAVLFSHSYWFTSGSKLADPLVRFTGHSIGEHAVQVFFFLSGILVAQSLLRSRSVLDFAVARALRIFPALIVCVLLTAFVLGPLFTQGSLVQYFADKQLPLYVLKTLALVTGSAPLPHLFHDQALPEMVNVSLWTLKYEVLCYIGLGLVGGAGLLHDRLRPITTAFIAILVLTVFVGQPKPLDTYTFLDNLRYFALYFYAGVLAYLFKDRVYVSGVVLVPLAAACALFLGTRLGELATCLFLGYATLWVSTFRFGGLRAFTNQNDYSYGVYIFAGPIQQLVISFLPEYGPTLVSLHTVSIALPLAVFSWELVERPAIAMRKPVLKWIGVLASSLPGNSVQPTDQGTQISLSRMAFAISNNPKSIRLTAVKRRERPAKLRSGGFRTYPAADVAML
jgi:peptidoglycan/LPS O-acetylase OafA/YrhL